MKQPPSERAAGDRAAPERAGGATGEPARPLDLQSACLELVHEAVFVFDFDGGITYWNRGAEEVYGWTREEALGRNPHDLLQTSPSSGTFRPIVERDGRWEGELTHRSKDGAEIIVDSRMARIGDDDGRRLVLEANTPITERRRLERALRDRALQLAQADKSKDEFLAMLSHELRNPLTPLLNALRLLAAPDVGEDDVQRLREMTERQGRAMVRMLDDLLDVARVTRGRIRLRKERLDLRGVVDRTVAMVSEAFRESGIELAVSVPDHEVVAEADAVRIEQVVMNLLDNARRFSSAGGHAWLELSVEPPDAGPAQAVLRVRDDGIGIAAEALPRVFDVFMQEDTSLEHRRGGVGVGLTLARRLVEMHGGTIEASSAGPGKGSTFTIRLPLAEPAAALAAPAAAKAAPARGPGKRILVVDDSVDSAESLAMLLRLSGHDVRTAADGPSALATAAEFLPEVIVLDIGLPGLSGYEVAAELRRREANAGALLVALSGHGQEDDRRMARQAGFDHHLLKPLDYDALCEAIARTRREF